ncbi:hypothetical protein UFOVP59_16 [uncultured Caudovirales phage]|uniref:Uncharacterized protein n=1 Tax=uncultured Caudovirales phage TaxID=2100421 RepID=A0A6J5KTV9_9CAUD|nr:hypothetical protein UFOVP59_16 [uncultured Caudovirales phage]CAB5220630.1 hypothetical protein UFOVP246_16 [uncultured Caudovirales phage]
MSASKTWYKWPKGYFEKGWLPWYTILIRLFFFPIAFTLIVTLMVTLFFSYGKDEATDLWEHFF